MPEEDKNFGGSLVWMLEKDDVACKRRIACMLFSVVSAETLYSLTSVVCLSKLEF